MMAVSNQQQQEQNPFFTRLSVGSTFSGIFELLWKEWVLFFGIGFIFFIPLLLFTISWFLVNQEAGEQFREEESNIDTTDIVAIGTTLFKDLMGHLHSVWIKILLEVVFTMFVGIIGESAITIAVAEIYAQTSVRPTIMSSFQKAIKLFCQVWCPGFICGTALLILYGITGGIVYGLFLTNVAILQFLAVILALAVMAGGIFIAVALKLIPSVVMIENKGPMDTVKRCWELANNHRCYIFCTSYCLALAINVCRNIIMTLVFANDPLAKLSVLGAILHAIPEIIQFPLLAIASTVVYLNIRVMSEGMNHQVLMKDLEGSSSTSYTTVKVILGEDDDDTDDRSKPLLPPGKKEMV